MPHGQGELRSSDGPVFVGVFENGSFRSGTKTQNGMRCKGNWREDETPADGYIELSMVDGRGWRYEGQSRNCLPHGRGKYVDLDDGETYDGEWVDGEPQGHGTSHYSNGNKAVGTFWKGELSGYGEMTFQSGDRYIGYWLEGKWHGHGVFILGRGGKFTGDWSNGVLQGNVEYVDALGVSIRGTIDDLRRMESAGELNIR
jgi:hypothetical protein